MQKGLEYILAGLLILMQGMGGNAGGIGGKPGGMAGGASAGCSGPTFVSGGGDFTGGGAYTTAFSPANGSSLVVVSVANDQMLTHTCSDSEGTGNTYTPDGAQVGAGANAIAIRIFHASNISGSGTYTITCTGTTPIVAAVNVSGKIAIETTSAGTNPSGSNAGASPIVPTAFTPTHAATILVDAYGNLASSAITLSENDTNYTLDASELNGAIGFVGAIGHRVVASSASYSDGWITNTPSAQVAINAAYQCQ